jgi:signal transduction histidine kinase
MRRVTAADARPARSPDWPLLATALVLGAGTLALVVEPDLRFLVAAPGLDLVITTVATLAATGVSALAWTRFQLQGGPASALQAAAFAILAAAGFLFLAAVVTGLDGGVGLTLAMPTQAPVYILVWARLLAGALLLLGAWLERSGRPVKPAVARRTVLVGLVLFLGVAAVAMRASASLPELVPATALAELATNAANAESVPGATAFGGILQLAAAGLFLAAAVLYRQLERSAAGRPRVGYLSAGLVIAGFSQLHAALHPGGYTTLVTSGDVLRLVFYLVLLVGVAAEVRQDLRALQSANAELERMRESDMVRATLEERGRLAREIHDGLAQDLWYAKLKQARVAQAGELDGTTRITANEVLAAIDTALADARQAVSALREGTTGAALSDVVRDAFEDFTDRFGLRGTFECDDDLPPISPRGQAEVLRIVQEALNNVRKHADATVIRLRLERADAAGVRISITDNGRGFDPGDVPADRFGLRTMRERAEMIGARLTIDSQASGGTAIVVEVPGTGATA